MTEPKNGPALEKSRLPRKLTKTEREAFRRGVEEAANWMRAELKRRRENESKKS